MDIRYKIYNPAGNITALVIGDNYTTAEKRKDKLTELSSKYDFKVNIIEEIKPFFNEIEFIKERKTANFMTEASIIKDTKVKKVILGPGPVTAHEIDEHISIESYQKTINQYKEIIEKLCN